MRAASNDERTGVCLTVVGVNGNIICCMEVKPSTRVLDVMQRVRANDGGRRNCALVLDPSVASAIQHHHLLLPGFCRYGT